jgi:hypothetical protein
MCSQIRYRVSEIASPDRSKRMRHQDVKVALDMENRVQLGHRLNLRTQPQGHDHAGFKIIQVRRLHVDDQRATFTGSARTPGKSVEVEAGH